MFTVKVQRRTFRDISDLSLKMKGPTKVRVGFPKGTDSDIVMRAVWNEFGTRGGASGGGWGGPVPERPFMRGAMRANRSKYQKMMSKSASMILLGTTSLTGALRLLGAEAVSDIQDEILSLKSPPNSPLTQKLKGSSNPLISSGEMRQRVSWKVDD
ncbi:MULTISPECIES: hypothetical protein [unclassified Aurantimonas]|uniref:hypothetical protein n=1 Tax=unclassified Aurantimonas TaxID=2638230 RepID=UPI002E186233|nr:MULTISPECIES: hypothetical protein [unclassified Aurantimonas]MEC5289388.1 hypothetical protein [Aurantimonas sp. C2-3-R2]MEC5410468.1 hypothetical protein [Aurantimonas sp. C2-4-R8]